MQFIQSEDGKWVLITANVLAHKEAEIALHFKSRDRQPEEFLLRHVTPEWEQAAVEFKATREFAELERLRSALAAKHAELAQAENMRAENEQVYSQAVAAGDGDAAFEASPQFFTVHMNGLQNEAQILARAVFDAHQAAKFAFEQIRTRTALAIASSAGQQRRESLQEFIDAVSPLLDDLAQAALRLQQSNMGPQFEILAGRLPPAAAAAAPRPVMAGMGVGQERSITL